MILIIDNYDSFTYNLVQMVESLYDTVKIIKNDDHTVETIAKMNPKGIILSPGPCTPNKAGVCLDLVKYFYDKIPILGICLGHQVIAQSFGSLIIEADHLMHGKVDKIFNDGQGLFADLHHEFTATRYHSLIVDDCHLSTELMVTARSSTDQYIMGLRHIHYPVEGLQFHPESYKTEFGMTIISQYIELVRTGGYYV
jgi:anthranilate synthase/aminodeoxychorismate synthase-like glutamine amidotransferase